MKRPSIGIVKSQVQARGFYIYFQFFGHNLHNFDLLGFIYFVSHNSVGSAALRSHPEFHWFISRKVHFSLALQNKEASACCSGSKLMKDHLDRRNRERDISGWLTFKALHLFTFYFSTQVTWAHLTQKRMRSYIPTICLGRRRIGWSIHKQV